MDKTANPAPAEKAPPVVRPPACGNRMCDLCTEIRCRKLQREEDEPSPAVKR